MQNAYCE